MIYRNIECKAIKYTHLFYYIFVLRDVIIKDAIIATVNSSQHLLVTMLFSRIYRYCDKHVNMYIRSRPNINRNL